MKMFKLKRGFTIIEVSLFLALSGFLMVGLIIGANTSISRQRYNDSINNFTDFLRNAYADTLNVSNANDKSGRTKTAIYGKLITFGEVGADNKPESKIYVYDVVGNAISSSAATSATVLEMLKNSSEINGNIIKSESAGGGFTNSFYGMSSYVIPWDGEIQKPNNPDGSVNNNLFTGAILIVRSPTTGGIRTYVYSGENLKFHTATELTANGSLLLQNILGNFHEGQLDLCLESPDNKTNNRRDFRILERANNSTGVFVVGLDDEDSKCLGR